MKMAARQVMNIVKNTIENLIVTQSLAPANKTAFNDVDFVKDIIKTAISKFEPANVDSMQLSLILPEEKEAEFQSFINNKTIKTMSEGININFDKRFKAGFKIAPKDKGYYISFTDQDFENLFKEYLRPKMIKLLFEE